MTTAKKLKQDAYYVDIREKEWYRFSPEKLQIFIEQLCKEQRENSALEANLLRDIFVTDELLYKCILNAKNPDV